MIIDGKSIRGIFGVNIVENIQENGWENKSKLWQRKIHKTTCNANTNVK